jgi:hypothetical protein
VWLKKHFRSKNKKSDKAKNCCAHQNFRQQPSRFNMSGPTPNRDDASPLCPRKRTLHDVGCGSVSPPNLSPNRLGAFGAVSFHSPSAAVIMDSTPQQPLFCREVPPSLTPTIKSSEVKLLLWCNNVIRNRAKVFGEFGYELNRALELLDKHFSHKFDIKEQNNSSSSSSTPCNLSSYSYVVVLLDSSEAAYINATSCCHKTMSKLADQIFQHDLDNVAILAFGNEHLSRRNRFFIGSTRAEILKPCLMMNDGDFSKYFVLAKRERTRTIQIATCKVETMCGQTLGRIHVSVIGLEDESGDLKLPLKRGNTFEKFYNVDFEAEAIQQQVEGAGKPFLVLKATSRGTFNSLSELVQPHGDLDQICRVGNKKTYTEYRCLDPKVNRFVLKKPQSANPNLEVFVRLFFLFILSTKTF